MCCLVQVIYTYLFKKFEGIYLFIYEIAAYWSLTVQTFLMLNTISVLKKKTLFLFIKESRKKLYLPFLQKKNKHKCLQHG